MGTMVFDSVAIGDKKEMVAILLPAIKTDPMAQSCTRAWGCVCPEGKVDEEACPFHAAKAQVPLLNKTFGSKVDEDGFPSCASA